MALDPRSFSILEVRENINYGRQGLPAVRDGQIRDLLLGAVDGVPFEQVQRLVPPGGDRVLNAFAKRAASIAVRCQDARELRAGILAAAISQVISGDPREPLVALALLYRAAEMIGHDPHREFAAVRDLTGGHANGLLDFLRRSPEDKSIEAMGYGEGDDKGEFRFVCNW